MVHVSAQIRQRGTGARDEAAPQSGQLAADGPTYGEARDEILAHVPAGWIVASWIVDRG